MSATTETSITIPTAATMKIEITPTQVLTLRAEIAA